MVAATGSEGELRVHAARSIGTPIRTVLVTASTVATWPDGRPVLVTVGGNPDLPVAFTVVDLTDGAVLAHHRIANSGRSHAVTTIDGVVHVASWGGGNLFRYEAAADRLVDLGMALPGQFTVAALEEAGPVAYGGTFPGGRLFRFDPADERVDDLGRVDPEADLVRAVAWDGSRVLVGTEPHARLHRVNPTTGAKALITLPPDAVGSRSVDDLAVRGDLLFVHVAPSSTYHVLDLASWTWVGQLPRCMRGVTGPDGSDRVHVVDLDGALHAYDLTSHTVTPTGWTTPTGPVPGHGGIHQVGHRIVGISEHGKLWEYDPLTRAGRAIPSDIPASGVTIRALGVGPSGQVLVGGSLAPTTYAEWDPGQQRVTTFTGGPRSRIDAFATVGGRIHFSEYPSGTVYAYEPGEPWSGPPGNPRPLFSLADTLGQERIFALLPDGDDLVLGSTGGRGVADGHLLRWSATREDLTDLGVPLPGHSVVSLTKLHDQLIGGTSVQVLGAPPMDTEAKVFLTAPDGTMSWYGTPQPGAQAICALTTANGQVWGLTNSGFVFRLDPATRTFHDLAKVGPEGGLWGMGSLQAHRSWLMGATGSGTVFAFHTQSHRVTYLGLGEHAVLAADALHWASSSELITLPLTGGGHTTE